MGHLVTLLAGFIFCSRYREKNLPYVPHVLSCFMDYVCRSLTHVFLNECSLFSLICLLCFELTENYSLQTCFPFTQLTFSNQYALLQILHTVVSISSQKSCILDKTHLSLKESCVCAGPAGQINELSILGRNS